MVRPATSENIPGRTLVVLLALELQQDQTVYVLVDAGSVLDSSGNSLAGTVNSDSNFAVEEQVIVPNGTVTLPVGEASTTTSIVISLTVSVPLAEEDTSLVGPGDSEIGLNLTTVVLVDGTWIFTLSVVLLEVAHSILRSTPMRSFFLSSTGHVALARPASINVVACTRKNRFHDCCS